MKQTFRAILHGNRLEWLDSQPEGNEPVEVELVLSLNESSGPKMAQALERLAAKDSLASIPNPSAWQAELRNDRKLPER